MLSIVFAAVTMLLSQVLVSSTDVLAVQIGIKIDLDGIALAQGCCEKEIRIIRWTAASLLLRSFSALVSFFREYEWLITYLLKTTYKRTNCKEYFCVVQEGKLMDEKEKEYEIIAGHRRKTAAEWAGLREVPVIVRDLDDDQAVIAMVDSNLQREHLLPSEKAYAYKMRLEAMKHQGRRLNPAMVQIEPKEVDVIGLSGRFRCFCGRVELVI